SDEPGTLGGKGVQPSPLTYVLFGVMACYGSSLAAECAEEGLAIKDMKVRGKLSYDLGPVVTDVKTPIITGLKLEIISSTNLETQIKKAWAKCPAVYAIQNPIPTEIVQVSK
ncbi:MAG: OsmC family protein, partial [Candidatus Thermoplasmatota archaeon]|nr:OsmC family protein [Candidatus Thermoplasmatota archaeon]